MLYMKYMENSKSSCKWCARPSQSDLMHRQVSTSTWSQKRTSNLQNYLKLILQEMLFLPQPNYSQYDIVEARECIVESTEDEEFGFAQKELSIVILLLCTQEKFPYGLKGSINQEGIEIFSCLFITVCISPSSLYLADPYIRPISGCDLVYQKPIYVSRPQLE